MAPAAPTCQLSLKQELKGAQKGLEFLPPPGVGEELETESGNEKGPEQALKARQAGRNT